MSSIDCRDIPVDQRLFDKVVERIGPRDKNGCELWMLTPKPDGYGAVWCGWFSPKTSFQAHRAAFKMYNPHVDMSGKVVMHSCDNRLCCAKEHLSLGTVGENNADMVSKGRQATGWSVNTAKVIDNHEEIRRRRAAGETCVTLAEEFGISPQRVSQIARGVK